MAEEKRWHLGPGGPGICRARKNPCRYGESNHGSKEEMSQLWEKKLEEEYSSLPDPLKSSQSREAFEKSRKTMGTKARYSAEAKSVRYGESDRDIAMRLALSSRSPLSYLPIEDRDESFQTNGFSQVERYSFEDGSVGYFKPFGSNSFDEASFEDYGTNSLRASIAEANAYRLATALGKDFKELLPETAFREINGAIGTIQRGVGGDSGSYYSKSLLKKNQLRKAAIFDFVAGNLDRHGGNYLVDEEDSHALHLIDNSFCFPANRKTAMLNVSTLTKTDNFTVEELKLTRGEIDGLKATRGEVERWIEDGTMPRDSGKGTIERIDILLEKKELQDFSNYFYGHYDED